MSNLTYCLKGKRPLYSSADYQGMYLEPLMLLRRGELNDVFIICIRGFSILKLIK